MQTPVAEVRKGLSCRVARARPTSSLASFCSQCFNSRNETPSKKGVSAALIAMRAFSSLRPRLLTRGLRTGAPRGYPSYPLFTSC